MKPVMLNFFLARNNKINKEEVKNNILDILIDVVTYYVVTHTHTDKQTRLYIYIYIYRRIHSIPKHQCDKRPSLNVCTEQNR